MLIGRIGIRGVMMDEDTWILLKAVGVGALALLVLFIQQFIVDYNMEEREWAARKKREKNHIRRNNTKSI